MKEWDDRRGLRFPLFLAVFVQVFACFGQEINPAVSKVSKPENLAKLFHRRGTDGYLTLHFFPLENDKWKLTIFPGDIEVQVYFETVDKRTYRFEIVEDRNVERVVEALKSNNVNFEIDCAQNPSSDFMEIISLSNENWFSMLTETAKQNTARLAIPDRRQSQRLF